MGLTIDQVLQQAITEHRDGNTRDAERLYRIVLESEPDHPSANYNLGELAVSVGKMLEAVPLFQRALNVDSKNEQLRFSYIETLIKLERVDDAKQALVEAKNAGVAGGRLEALESQLLKSKRKKEKKGRVGLKLSEKRKKQAQKKASKNQSKGQPLHELAPSQDQLKILQEHYQAKRLQTAESLAKSMTEDFPRYALGWKILGSIRYQTGDFSRALMPLRKSIALAPYDPESHNNLGNTLRALGKLSEADAAYRQAANLNPNYGDAFSNLALVLRDLDRLGEAEISLHRAISLQPNTPEIRFNLGVTLKELGRLDEAEVSLKEAIKLRPEFADAHKSLGNVLRDLSKLDEALNHHRKSVALKPHCAEMRVELGVTLFGLGRMLEAEASLNHAASLNPHSR